MQIYVYVASIVMPNLILFAFQIKIEKSKINATKFNQRRSITSEVPQILCFAPNVFLEFKYSNENN